MAQIDTDLVRAMVVDFGSIASVAREADIARSTLSDHFVGSERIGVGPSGESIFRERGFSEATAAKISDFYDSLNPDQQDRIQAIRADLTWRDDRAALGRAQYLVRTPDATEEMIARNQDFAEMQSTDIEDLADEGIRTS